VVAVFAGGTLAVAALVAPPLLAAALVDLPLLVAALVGAPLLAAAISWDHVPSRSTAVDSTIDLASIGSIDFIGSIVLPSIGSIDFIGSIDLASIGSIDFIGSIGLASIGSIDFIGSIGLASIGSIDFIGSIVLPSIDSIDFIGSTDLASIDSIDFIGSIALASIGSIDFIGSIGLASIASIDLPSVVRSSDLGSPFKVAALTRTVAPATLAHGLAGGGAGGGRATERERRTMARQRLSGTPYRRACSSPPGTRAPILTPWSDSTRSGHPVQPDFIHLVFICMSSGLGFRSRTRVTVPHRCNSSEIAEFDSERLGCSEQTE